MPRRIKIGKGQLSINFGQQKAEQRNILAAQAPIKKTPSLQEKRELKTRALNEARRAYAIIMREPHIFRGIIDPRTLELYRREIGSAIGALKKGRLSTKRAQAVIGQVTGLLQKVGKK